jgi:hypothetical protein
VPNWEVRDDDSQIGRYSAVRSFSDLFLWRWAESVDLREKFRIQRYNLKNKGPDWEQSTDAARMKVHSQPGAGDAHAYAADFLDRPADEEGGSLQGVAVFQEGQATVALLCLTGRRRVA